MNVLKRVCFAVLPFRLTSLPPLRLPSAAISSFPEFCWAIFVIPECTSLLLLSLWFNRTGQLFLESLLCAGHSVGRCARSREKSCSCPAPCGAHRLTTWQWFRSACCLFPLHVHPSQAGWPTWSFLGCQLCCFLGLGVHVLVLSYMWLTRDTSGTIQEVGCGSSGGSLSKPQDWESSSVTDRCGMDPVNTSGLECL